MTGAFKLQGHYDLSLHHLKVPDNSNGSVAPAAIGKGLGKYSDFIMYITLAIVSLVPRPCRLGWKGLGTRLSNCTSPTAHDNRCYAGDYISMRSLWHRIHLSLAFCML